MSASLLEQILNDPKALSVRFQPIFRLGPKANEIDSLEGLIRGPKGTNFENASLLFDYVRRKHAEAAVDRSCILAICRAVAEMECDCRINLNVHASTLGQNTDFVDFFRSQARFLGLPLDRFTLEIVEHSPTHNVPGLIYTLRTLRDLGIRIALDDVGLGNSNYRMILDCHPDYFKIDTSFVQGVSYDPDRRAVIKSITCLAEEMKGVVVAEGAQATEDLSTLTRMGIKLFQAHLLCPPVTPQELLTKEFFKTQPLAPASCGSVAHAFEHPGHGLLPSVTRLSICQ
jgi:EAL domain-containing protein (putative c-di-GMP-specific phosphodiesterase class I)